MKARDDSRVTAYGFEAKGIQGFILNGGRLRDAVGASILVDSLCLPRPAGPPQGGLPAAGLLDDALDRCGLREGETLRFTRRAAGAFTFVAIGPEAAGRAARFRALWTLTVALAAPGLDFVDVLASGPTAPEALRRVLAGGQGRRSRLSVMLPLAPPPARVAPRTGLAAVAVDASDAEPVDAPTRRKRAHFAASGRDQAGAARWLGAAADRVALPADMDTEFPFPTDDRTVGLLHADGNRMGQILMTLQARLAERVAGEAMLPAATFSPAENEYLAGLAGFSVAVGNATERAFAAALEAHVLLHALPDDDADGRCMLPARPILLGGDDLTILLRGDIAMEFARGFLEHFEVEAAAALQPVLGTLGDGFAPLTACAGIAFVGDSFPFDRALRLAEDLCRHAKGAAKRAAAAKGDGLRVPSCLSFHRATASLLDTYEAIEESLLTQRDASGSPIRILTMQPYAVGGGDPLGLPDIEALRTLKAMFAGDRIARGAARELVELLQAEPDKVAARYGRWREVMAGGAGPLAAFDSALAGLRCAGPGHLEPRGGDGGVARTPLADALTWHVVTRAAANEELPA